MVASSQFTRFSCAILLTGKALIVTSYSSRALKLLCHKTKEVFILLSYSYDCEQPVCMRCTVTQFARENVRLCPFRGSYVKEFELSHSNLVKRVFKITAMHAIYT